MKTYLYVIIKTFCLSIILSTVFASYAAIPTMEGLFRNGANKDIGAELIILKLQIEEKDNDALMEKYKLDGNEERLKEFVEREKVAPKFIELIFEIDNGNKYKMIQNEYASKKFDANELLRSDMFLTARKTIEEIPVVKRNLLYSSLAMFVLNDSGPISDFIKKYNKDFELNNEVMNSEKVDLLKQYQKYLNAMKEDKEVAEEIESPLNPADDGKRQQVVSIKDARMYKTSEHVKLVRENGLFFWVIQLENFTARFFNSNHLIDYLTMNMGEGNLEMKCSEYMLYDGKHFLPKYFMIKDLKDRLFKVSMIKLRHFKKSSMPLKERHKIFLENISKNVGTNAQIKPNENDIIL